VIGLRPTLSPDYRVERLDDSGFRGDDVVEMWSKHVGMTTEQAVERLPEVMLVGVHSSDGLVGVMTAYLEFHPQLQFDCWFQRVFVVPDHRSSHLSIPLILEGMETLEKRYVDGKDRRGRCVVHELESRLYRTRFHDPSEAMTEMTFIGENARGDPSGVHYFPGALAPTQPRQAA